MARGRVQIGRRGLHQTCELAGQSSRPAARARFGAPGRRGAHGCRERERAQPGSCCRTPGGTAGRALLGAVAGVRRQSGRHETRERHFARPADLCTARQIRQMAKSERR